MTRYKGTHIDTLATEDVGHNFIHPILLGHMPLTDVLGYVQKQDVGKWIMQDGKVLSVENNDQFTARMEQEGRKLPL